MLTVMWMEAVMNNLVNQFKSLICFKWNVNVFKLYHCINLYVVCIIKRMSTWINLIRLVVRPTCNTINYSVWQVYPAFSAHLYFYHSLSVCAKETYCKYLHFLAYCIVGHPWVHNQTFLLAHPSGVAAEGLAKTDKIQTGPWSQLI